MDRNLGALDDKYHDKANNKCKYYQWGRKDPFNCLIYCWSYDPETFATTKTSTADGLVSKMSKDLIDSSEIGGFNTGGHNVPFSVSKPTTFICNTSATTNNYVWSSTSDLFGGTTLEDNKTTKYWNDPRPFIRLENEEISSAGYENKSFFDPCPLGWRMPLYGYLNGFIGDGSGSATGNARANFQYGVDNEFKNRGTGRTYVPLGYLSQKGNQNAQTAFFPSLSAYSYGGGYPGSYNGYDGQYWYANPYNSYRGRMLGLSTWAFAINYDYARCYGLTVRCVKEY